MLRVECAEEVCRSRVEAVVESVVFGVVASVLNSETEMLVVLLSPTVGVAGNGGVVVVVLVVIGGVVVMVVMKAVVLKVSPSVICDLSVIVTGVVETSTLVIRCGMSVRVWSTSDVLLMTVGDSVVRYRSVFSLVWDEAPSVLSWFRMLEL